MPATHNVTEAWVQRNTLQLQSGLKGLHEAHRTQAAEEKSKKGFLENAIQGLSGTTWRLTDDVEN
jgi:hypothetical protein